MKVLARASVVKHVKRGLAGLCSYHDTINIGIVPFVSRRSLKLYMVS